MLYNKPLLRLFVFLLLITLGLPGYIYLTQSAAKLGTQGLLDALAVYSFIIAAYLLILVAEVGDSHYLRAMGALGTLVGCAVGTRFIFVLDAPHLESGPMGVAFITFILGMALALVYLALVVGRLVYDKVQATRMAAVHDERGPAPSRPVSEAIATAEPAATRDTAAVGASAGQEGAGEPALVGVAGPYLGQRFPLKQGDNFIGRSEGDIVLSEDRQVSRRHCVVTWAEDSLKVRDLGSTNGTYVGGQRTAESTIAQGDLIGIGAGTYKVA
ncbi:FHA domain-containing protein [bacterium]|nr:FHA domain-containing protein [bacterium]